MSKLLDYIKDEIETECAPELERVKKSYSELQDIILPMVNKNIEEERKEEIVNTNEYKHYMFINYEFVYLYFTWKDVYKIYDTEQQLKYKIVGKNIFGCHHFKIYKGDKKVGYIKRNLITYFNLEFEYSIKKTKIQIEGEPDYFIRSYKESGTRHYSIKRKYWKITYSKKEDKYSIYYNNRVIAKVSKPLKSSAHSNKSWVIGYDDLEKEFDIAVLVASIWNQVRK